MNIKTPVKMTVGLFAIMTIAAFSRTKYTPPAVVHLSALPPTVQLGVYDNVHSFGKLKTITFEHIWVWWDRYTSGELLPQLKAIVAKGRTPLISIEPWTIKSIGSDDTLLFDIASGKYDEVTFAIANEIKTLGSTVYIRWGHEMDDLALYPWSTKRAADYIAAFREVAFNLKMIVPTSPIVWAPIGNKSCETYYPGDDVVDYTGFTVLEYPQVSTRWFGKPQSFSGWMDEKYPRVAGFNKPVIITELGIFDTPANQKAWIQDAFASIKNYPLVKVLVYFNTRDSMSWAKWGGTQAPDWTISPDVFKN